MNGIGGTAHTPPTPVTPLIPQREPGIFDGDDRVPEAPRESSYDSSSSSSSLVPKAAEGTLLGPQFKEDMEKLEKMKRPSPNASPEDQIAGAFFGGSAQWLGSFGTTAVIVKVLQTLGHGDAALHVYPLSAGILQGAVTDHFRKAAADNYGVHPGVALTAWNNWVIAQSNSLGVRLTGNKAQCKKAMAQLDKALNEMILSQQPGLVKFQQELKKTLQNALLTLPAEEVEAALKDLKESKDIRFNAILARERNENWASYVGTALINKFFQEDLPLACWASTLGLAGITSPAALILAGGERWFLAVDIIAALLMGATAGGAGALVNNLLRGTREGSVAKAGNHHAAIQIWAHGTVNQESAEKVIQEAGPLINQLNARIQDLEDKAKDAPDQAQPFTLAELKNVKANAESILRAAQATQKFHTNTGQGLHGRNVYATWKSFKTSLSTAEKRWALFHKLVGNVSSLYLYSFASIKNMSEKMQAVKNDITSGHSSFNSPAFHDAALTGGGMGISFTVSYVLRSVVTPTSYFVLGVPWAAARTLAERCCSNPEDDDAELKNEVEAKEKPYHELGAATALAGESDEMEQGDEVTVVEEFRKAMPLTVDDYQNALGVWDKRMRDLDDTGATASIGLAIKNLARGVRFETAMTGAFGADEENLASYRGEIFNLMTGLSEDDVVQPVLKEMIDWIDRNIGNNV